MPSCGGWSHAAFGKIKLLFAFFTDMFFVELIGKDFHFLAAGTASAEKRLQTPKLFKPGTMLGGSHGVSFLFQ
jgi:hypothetical protein